MLISTHACLLTQLVPERNLLRHQWQGDDLTDYRPAMTALFAALRTHDVRLWLADTTHLPDITADLHGWSIFSLVPQLLRLPLTRMALVLDHNPLNRWVMEDALYPLHRLLPFDLQIFGDAATALAWLNEEAALPAQALQEWHEANCWTAAAPPAGPAQVAEAQVPYRLTNRSQSAHSSGRAAAAA